MNKVIKKYRMPGKKPSHRNAIIKSLILELVRAEKIKTTPTKAKIIKSQFDHLVTKAKKDNEASKKIVRGFFNSNERAIDRFYSIVKTKLNDRTSGYTRVFHTLPRKGDGAQQSYIMLVNFEKENGKTSSVEKLLEKQKKKADKKSIGGKIKKAVTRK